MGRPSGLHVMETAHESEVVAFSPRRSPVAILVITAV
jgi:hypothetical protein